LIRQKGIFSRRKRGQALFSTAFAFASLTFPKAKNTLPDFPAPRLRQNGKTCRSFGNIIFGQKHKHTPKKSKHSIALARMRISG